MITAIQAVQTGGFVQLKTVFFSAGAQVLPCLAPGLVMQSAHVSTPEAPLMEFIIVWIKNRPGVEVDVLINGQSNGTTSALITLGSPGWIFVSVDFPNAQQQNVNVTNTTATHPMGIEIDCGVGA